MFCSQTTPLSIALQKDNLKCAELLLNTDVNINFPDDKGSTILMNQMLSNLDDGVLEKVRFLVESKDADVKIKDMAGGTAVCYSSTFVLHLSRLVHIMFSTRHFISL